MNTSVIGCRLSTQLKKEFLERTKEEGFQSPSEALQSLIENYIESNKPESKMKSFKIFGGWDK